jgi:hypothetical protein
MPIFQNCTVFFVRCDPRFPSKVFNEDNPTWEIQLRTTDKAQKKEWENANLPVKSVLPDEGDPYWRVALRKKSLKKDKTTGEMVPTKAPTVVDGNLDPIEPNSVGNGSICNVDVFMYEYPKKGTTEVATGCVLRGIQVTTHVVYKPKPFVIGPAFEKTETVRIVPPPKGATEEIDPEDDVAF